MSETKWFPQYYNEENQERFGSSSFRPRLFDQWAYSCVGRTWEVLLRSNIRSSNSSTSSSSTPQYNWCEADIFSYEPYYPCATTTTARTQMFGGQKYDDDGSLSDTFFLPLTPAQVRPSVASWKKRTREVVSSIICPNSPSKEDCLKDLLSEQTSSILDEIFESITYRTSLPVPLESQTLGITFTKHPDSIEVKDIGGQSIAQMSAIHIGDVLVQCSSINAFHKPLFSVEHHDCTLGTVTLEDLRDFVITHKEWPNVSSIDMTLKRTLSGLVSFHSSMNQSGDITATTSCSGSDSCTTNEDASGIQQVEQAVRDLLQLHGRFNKQAVENDSDVIELCSHLSTIANCCSWYLRGGKMKCSLQRNERGFLHLDEFRKCIELGNGIISELNKLKSNAVSLTKIEANNDATAASSSSQQWFVHALLDVCTALSKGLEQVQEWHDKVQDMVCITTIDDYSNKNNNIMEKYELGDMIQALDEGALSTSDAMIAKFDVTNKLIDLLSQKVTTCQAYFGKLDALIEQFGKIPPTPWNKVSSDNFTSPTAISAVINNTGDTVLKSLIQLQTMISRTPELSNVKFSKLQYLIEARKWAMKSVHAHSSKKPLLRERLSFYQNLIDTATKYESVWTQYNIVPLISDQLKKIIILKSKVNSILVIDIEGRRKQAMITDVQLSFENSLMANRSIVTAASLEDALKTLSRFPFLAVFEEKLLVWLDVTKLTELVMSIRNTKYESKPTLNELSQLVKDSTYFSQGKSPRRNAATVGLIVDANADDAVCSFSRDFADTICSLQQDARPWLTEAEAWKESAIQILGSTDKAVKREKNTQLIAMHGNLHVCVTEEYGMLLEQARCIEEEDRVCAIRIAEEKRKKEETIAVAKTNISALKGASNATKRCKEAEKTAAKKATIEASTEIVEDTCIHTGEEEVMIDDSGDNGSSSEDDETDELDFSSETFAIENRFNIAACLLKRKRLSEDGMHGDGSSTGKERIYHLSSSLVSDKEPCNYRVKMRCLLAQCFSDGARNLGLQETTPTCQEYCSVLAWRLENIVYNNFSWIPTRNERQQDGKKEKYTEKLRSLHSNLKRNRTLCGGVLIGKLDLNFLVNLSSEELASKHDLNLREQAAKEAAKRRILDASDTEFGLLGLVQQRSSSFLAAVNKEKEVAEDVENLPARGSTENCRDADFSTETTEMAEPSSLSNDEITELLIPPNKGDSAALLSGIGNSFTEHFPVSNDVFSKVPDILLMSEPEDNAFRPALDVQLPEFGSEKQPVERYDSIDTKQNDSNQEDMKPSYFAQEDHNAELQQQVTATTSSEAPSLQQHVTATIPEAPSLQQQVTTAISEAPSLVRQTSEWSYKIIPQGGGKFFFFNIKEKVVTGFRASLLLEKNPEVLENAFPYALNEDRSCSFASFRDFISKKQKDHNFVFINCRLSLSPTTIENQDRYRIFRRIYEDKDRVPIIKLGGDVTLYLIVPKLGMILQNTDKTVGLTKGRIESTHLIVAMPRK